MTCRVLKPDADIYNVNLDLPSRPSASSFSEYLDSQENLQPPRYVQDPLTRQLVSAPVKEDFELRPPDYTDNTLTVINLRQALEE